MKSGKVSLPDDVLGRFLIIFIGLNAVDNSVLPPASYEGPDPFALLVFLYWWQWIYSVKEESCNCESGQIRVCLSVSVWEKKYVEGMEPEKD